ncbi:hypothetical protein [Nioella sp. MMSF_3534]|uniref:hypothetical protein n=1 Tax=Nioella sp. MMSF_3534 TaxID=3046720 RepID=UPI00273F0EA8|nr:hypothetical protein [Nioella sp. MMSF_3534]
MRSVLVHFEVSESHILLETFVSSAQAAARTVTALNNELFGGQVVFELVVYPPEAGSLKQYIGVSVKFLKAAGTVYAVVWSLIQLMDSASVKDISRELFGATPSEVIVQRIRDYRTRVEETPVDAAEDQLESLRQDGYEIVEELLVQGTSSSLGAAPETLESSTIPDELSYELRLAQSELFEAALEDQNVRGISFQEEDQVPIPRNQFAVRGVRPLPPRRNEDEGEWEVSLQQVRITSPVFERENPQRKWMGVNAKGSNVLFDIVDSEFWSRLLAKEIKFSEGSVIVVQMATRVRRKGPREKIAVRVLSLDGLKLAEQLDGAALASILGKIKAPARNDQDTLI